MSVKGRKTKTNYDNDHAKMVAEKPDRLLLSIKPMTEADARAWVGACNAQDASKRVTEHFVSQVRRLA